MEKKEIKPRVETFNDVVDRFVSGPLKSMAQSGRLQKDDATAIIFLLAALQTIHETEIEELKAKKVKK